MSGKDVTHYSHRLTGQQRVGYPHGFLKERDICVRRESQTDPSAHLIDPWTVASILPLRRMVLAQTIVAFIFMI